MSDCRYASVCVAEHQWALLSISDYCFAPVSLVKYKLPLLRIGERCQRKLHERSKASDSLAKHQ